MAYTKASMDRLRKQTQGKLSVYTKDINQKEKLLASAKKQKYPKYMIDELKNSIKKSKEAKEKFVKFAKFTNKLK
jgi:hypothetical protein